MPTGPSPNSGFTMNWSIGWNTSPPPPFAAFVSVAIVRFPSRLSPRARSGPAVLRLDFPRGAQHHVDAGREAQDVNSTRNQGIVPNRVSSPYPMPKPIPRPATSSVTIRQASCAWLNSAPPGGASALGLPLQRAIRRSSASDRSLAIVGIGPRHRPLHKVARSRAMRRGGRSQAPPNAGALAAKLIFKR